MNITDDGIWMYECKPIIISARPWWRHPAFPWGWYSITTDWRKLPKTTINALGQYSPGDGGCARFTWDEITEIMDGGKPITPNEQVAIWHRSHKYHKD